MSGRVSLGSGGGLAALPFLVPARGVEGSPQRSPQPPRRDAAKRHRVSRHEDAQGGDRSRYAGQRGVLIYQPAPGRGRSTGREPGLEVYVADFQPTLGAMGLGVDAADEMTLMEDRQRVVAVHALGPRGVDLDAVVEAEQASGAGAVPEQRIEGREKRRSHRRGACPPGARKRGEIAREDEPAPRRTLDLDFRDLAALEHDAKSPSPRARHEAREREVARQIQLGRGAHGVQRALEVPALELFRRHRLHPGRVGHRALPEVVAFLEVLPRVNDEGAGHPEMVERVLDRPPRPPAALAGRPAALEIGIGHRSVRADGVLDRAQHLRVPAQPARPAGVPAPVVEHSAPPPRQRGGRHEAGGVRPVLEEQPAPVHEPVEARTVVGAEAAPHRQVVRALEHVDRVELKSADVLDEAREARRRERGGVGSRQVLALEEERGDGAETDPARRHARELITVSNRCRLPDHGGHAPASRRDLRGRLRALPLGRAGSLQHRRRRVRPPCRRSFSRGARVRGRRGASERAHVRRVSRPLQSARARAGGARHRARRPCRHRAAAAARDRGSASGRLPAGRRRLAALDPVPSGRARVPGARVVVTDGENLERVLAVAKGLPDLARVISVDRADADGVVEYRRALDGISDSFDPIATTAEDPAILIYTSGTTGPPKGALHAHRVLLGHLPAIEFYHEYFPKPGDRHWSPADWAWAGGLLDVLLPSWHYGVTVVAHRPKKFDAERAFDILARHHVRNTFLVPTMLKMMRAVGDPRGRWPLALRSMFTGGEAVGEEVIHWAREALGVTPHEGFGQTEVNLVLGNCSLLMPVRPG